MASDLAMIPYTGRLSVSVDTLRQLANASKWQKITDLIAEEVQVLLGGHMDPVPLDIDYESSTGSPAYYYRGAVYLCPHVWKEALDQGLMSQGELIDSVFIVLAHELSHAWQDQNTHILSDKKLEAIYEGQAVFIQSIFANMLGLAEVNKKGIAIQMDENYWLKQYASREKALCKMSENTFSRFESAYFFYQHYLMGGMEKVKHIVHNPPDHDLLEQVIRNPYQYSELYE